MRTVAVNKLHCRPGRNLQAILSQEGVPVKAHRLISVLAIHHCSPDQSHHRRHGQHRDCGTDPELCVHYGHWRRNVQNEALTPYFRDLQPGLGPV